MSDPLVNQIIQRIKQAAELYYRLLLVVAPAGAGKTTVLRKVGDCIGTRPINVNLELSRIMLELTERQRALQLPPNVSADHVASLSPRLTILRHGLDDNLVMLREEKKYCSKNFCG